MRLWVSSVTEPSLFDLAPEVLPIEALTSVMCSWCALAHIGGPEYCAPAALAAELRARGHRLLTREGKFFVSDASKLTTADRAAIAAQKAALTALAEPWPLVTAAGEPIAAVTVPRITLGAFLGSAPKAEAWKPCEPPLLTGISTLEFDTETTGTHWWGNDRPIGLSCRRPDGSTFYLPWGHAGGNLDEQAVKRWCERELRGKHLVGHTIKFDIHMMHAWGIDLEAQGCTVGDVSIWAALLDSDRKKYSLDIFSKDFLGKEKTGQELDKTRMASYHASEVAAYAEMDVTLTGELRQAMMPLLDAQDLQRVRQLEDDVIFSVCEMEWNGVPLDMERLDRWCKESESKYTTLLWQLHKESGISAVAPQDMERLFNKLHIPLVRLPLTVADKKKGKTEGAASFTDDILSAIPHPTVQIARLARVIASLRSKFLVKYQKCVCSNGILRYSLHQTRYQDDKGEEGGVGPGRFSSSALDKSKDIGTNIQQVYRMDTQRMAFGYDADDSSHDEEIWLVRKLMIPGEGQWCSADAMQIEYRLMVDLGNITRVIDEYKVDPLLSFHRLTLKMMQKYKPDMTYGEQKNFNYAFSYGAKTVKLAMMLGFISEARAEEIKDAQDWNAPDLQRMREIEAAFDKVMPEAKQQMNRLSKLAESQGYVTDMLGRRSHFKVTYRKDGSPIKPDYYVGLNNYLQGGASEYGKRVGIEVHKNRKLLEIIPRFIVHDSNESSLLNPDKLPMYQELLNTQYFPELKVPILFSVGVGPTWADAK